MTPHMQRESGAVAGSSFTPSRVPGAGTHLERAQPLDLADEAGWFDARADRSISAPVDVVFDAWTDGAVRRLWLGGKRFRVRRSVPHQMLGLVADDGSTIEVHFFPRGPDQAFVVLEHRGLRGTGGVARSKGFWQEKLTRLKLLLEGV